MTLSKRQRVVIWSFVILTVILLGLRETVGEILEGEISGFYGFKDFVAFYGVKIPWPRVSIGGKTFHNNILFWLASQKYLLITVSALIGATLIITSKKK